MRRRQFLTGVAGAAGTGVAAMALGSMAAGSAQARGRSSTVSSTTGSWTAVDAPPAAGSARLESVAAQSANRAWAVGSQLRGEGDTPPAPLALVWDGTSWSEADTGHLGRNGGIRSVSSAGDENAWAVSHGPDGGGQLLGWDGTTWQHTPYPDEGRSGAGLNAVLAVAGGEAWAVGSRGEGSEPALLRWNGSVWQWTDPLPAGVSPSLLGLSRASDGSVWAYGAEAVVRWDGGWTQVGFTPSIRSGITGLVPTAPDDVWLIGWAYGVGGPPGKPPAPVLSRYDGTDWSSQDKPFSPGALAAITADGQGVPELLCGWDFWEQTSAHYARWEPAGSGSGAWVSERGPDAGTGSSVTQSALTAIPGTTGGYWSVGHLGDNTPRIERRT
ncbi:hypothetical protein MTQ01_01310 [Streptomyces sp. XM4193]|uniref:hypothetical protein n=1 Tax=Streptomyces sp. XM4193 TaxID=2929782 RepID=UPI001FFADA59|nr:hypothetical protein [Streptomyces sp. XM4193]MCK1794686.1 hypothetical protein [Streptomyces sp. XM4193]